MFTFELAGYIYTVAVDAQGAITKIACKGRWPLTDVVWIKHDKWLLNALQSQVDTILETSKCST